jgi:hypothetical protein
MKEIAAFLKERFPLHILTFTTLSSVLGAGAVSTDIISGWHVISAFVITTLFLFHVRAIDERRDFVNDSKLHPDRPVQQGLISIKQLLLLSISGILLSLLLALNASMATLIIALLFVGFTSLAAFDFFIPMYFKNKPVLYHIVNSPQMILTQWLIFSVYTESFAINTGMLLFMLLIYNNIFILEVVRKVKAPIHDTEDSYTAHLGIKKSVIFLILMVVAAYVIYYFILNYVLASTNIFYITGALLCCFVIGFILLFYAKPEKNTQKIMELSTVLLYVGLNILVYLAK